MNTERKRNVGTIMIRSSEIEKLIEKIDDLQKKLDEISKKIDSTPHYVPYIPPYVPDQPTVEPYPWTPGPIITYRTWTTATTDGDNIDK